MLFLLNAFGRVNCLIILRSKQLSFALVRRERKVRTRISLSLKKEKN